MTYRVLGKASLKALYPESYKWHSWVSSAIHPKIKVSSVRPNDVKDKEAMGNTVAVSVTLHRCNVGTEHTRALEQTFTECSY